MTIAARYNTLPNNGQWRLLLDEGHRPAPVRGRERDGSTQSIPTALTAQLSFNGNYIWIKFAACL
jgi:hypothetical protein